MQEPMGRLDTDFVRAQFPALAEPSLQGQAFFENAGGSYTCAPVIDRLTRYYHQRKVQPYGPYEASRLAGEEMDEARTRLAAMLGVEADELSFGPSTTRGTPSGPASMARPWTTSSPAHHVSDWNYNQHKQESHDLPGHQTPF